EVGASASYDEREVTLERLVINSGRSIINSSARFNPSTSDLTGRMVLEPVSWRDVLSYSDIPLVQDLNVSIGFQGNLSELEVTVQASAGGLRELSLRSLINADNQFSIRELSAGIDGFDGPRLTGDPQMPVLESFRIDGEGAVYPADPETSYFEAEFSISDIEIGGEQVDELAGQLNWEQQEGAFTASARRGGQSANFSVEVNRLFTDVPDWKGSVEGKRINLAIWTDNEKFDSELSFTAEGAGRGFSLSEELFQIQLNLSDSRWGNQVVDRISLEASLSDSRFEGQISGRIGESLFNSDFSTRNWQSPDPEYTFTVGLSRFNLSDLAGVEAFPTVLNVTVTGEGSGFDTERLDLSSTVRFDSSYVNNEPIQMLEANIEVRDRIMHVTRAELRSPVADGTFSLRQHLEDFRNQDNRLDLKAEVKDISSLSPLFGVQNINTHGRIEGHLYRQADGLLQFNGKVNLEELVYDTVFTVEKLAGSVGATLYEHPEVQLDLELDRPAMEAFTLQSIQLVSRSNLRDTLTEGHLELAVLEDEESAIRYAGDYRFRENDLNLITNKLEFQTPLRILTLQEPFDLSWTSDVLRMSPLRIATENGDAYLQLSIPYLDEQRQEVEMDARLLNLGVLQRTLFDETYAEALLSGQLSFQRIGTDISAESELLFTDIRRQEGRMDSLRTDLRLRDGRLQVSSAAWNNLEELYTFSGNVPCEPVDPMSLGEEFFEKPVEGKFTLNRSPVEYWSSFLGEAATLEAKGFVRFNGEVGGTAGDPVFKGVLSLRQGAISGVSIDSIMVDINYLHEDRNIRIDGYVESLGSRIASFESMLPLHLDMRRFRVDLPDESDEVYVSVITDTFNLALLNNFLDRDLFRDLRGSVSGNVEVKGALANPVPEGRVSIQNGSVRVIPTGIRLGSINSEVQFR
ncbi:MAG: hypothetical protein WD599_05615, partial [Balneolaceae bacterium]